MGTVEQDLLRHQCEVDADAAWEIEVERAKQEIADDYRAGLATDEQYSDLSEAVVCDREYDTAWTLYVCGNDGPLRALTQHHIDCIAEAWSAGPCTA